MRDPSIVFFIRVKISSLVLLAVAAVLLSLAECALNDASEEEEEEEEDASSSAPHSRFEGLPRAAR
jgi:hypothetical protein